MTTWIISLVSGLLGVLTGSIIQIIYNNLIEKNRILHDYKKICISEWLLLNKEIHDLIETPQAYNNTIFRQSIKQKAELLNLISAVNKKHENSILKLQKEIHNKDEEISLGDFAEEALNVGEVPENKAKFIREVSTLVNVVLKKLSTIY